MQSQHFKGAWPTEMLLRCASYLSVSEPATTNCYLHSSVMPECVNRVNQRHFTVPRACSQHPHETVRVLLRFLNASAVSAFEK